MNGVDKMFNEDSFRIAVVYSVNRLWISELVSDLMPYCSEMKRYPVEVSSGDKKLAEFTDKIVDYESDKYLGGICLYDKLPSKNEADIKQFNRFLRRFSPDIIIVADNISPDFISVSPRLGTLYVRFGESNRFGVLESLHGHDLTTCSLYLKTGDSMGIAASHSYKTIQHHPAVNISLMLSKAKGLIVKCVKKLYYGENVCMDEETFQDEKPSVHMSVHMYYLYLLYIKGIITEKLSGFLYADCRFLLCMKRGGENWNEDDIWNINSYIPYPVPEGRSWCDPCCISIDGREYVFFEDYDHELGHSHISMLTCKADGEFEYTDKVFAKPYHLSYPFVFQIDGVLYMIPETRANRTVDLYKCDKFPDEWSLCRTLIDNISAVDTTLLFYNNMIWLFSCVTSRYFESEADELFIFYTDDIINGEIKKHSSNPVVTDSRAARPGGAFIIEDDKIFRVSQDNSKERGLNLMEIIELSETAYGEKPAKKIVSCGAAGNSMHTVSIGESSAWIDGGSKSLRFKKSRQDTEIHEEITEK